MPAGRAAHWKAEIYMKELKDGGTNALQENERKQPQNLSDSKLQKIKGETYRVASLKRKILIFMSVVLIAVGALSAYISYTVYHDSAIAQHKELGKSTSSLVASIVNGNRIDEFIRKGEEARGYIETRNRLNLIKHSSENIEFVYVYKIMPDGCHVVFDLDSQDVEASRPGEVIPFEDAFKPMVPTLLAGGRIDPIISTDNYGWLLTVYTPVFDDDGHCRAYAGVDISMNDLKKDAFNYFLTVASIFAVIFFGTLAFVLMLARIKLITPINKMAKVTDGFSYSTEAELEENLSDIRSLKIRTGDEIENLYNKFVDMTEDSVRYMKDIQKKNETITKMHDALLITLADMVENRDENTGQHVRKTAAYTRIIMEELKREGVYADQLTDEFISNVFKSAPLHDVGKIMVPDAILNKPGKLTDEEFEIMKSHAAEGGKIVATMIEKVPDADYLKEAKNLATYHHEKWNGRGYPEGLAGEAIPLSARIMAVADVFDALVSNRCYKKGFPYPKALGIIREESGSHFDPKIVNAFLAVQDEALQIADAFFDAGDDVLNVLNEIVKQGEEGKTRDAHENA